MIRSGSLEMMQPNMDLTPIKELLLNYVRFLLRELP